MFPAQASPPLPLHQQNLVCCGVNTLLVTLSHAFSTPHGARGHLRAHSQGDTCWRRAKWISRQRPVTLFPWPKDKALPQAS